MTGAWRTIRRNDPADQYPERTDPSSPEFVVLACRTAARLAVAQGASAGDLREVLEALGLIEPLKPSVSLKVVPARQGDQTATDGPPTVTSGPGGQFRAPRRLDPTLCPKQLHPWTPENIVPGSSPSRGGSCRLCGNETRRVRRAANRTTKPAQPAVVITSKERRCASGEHVLPNGGRCGECKNRRARADRAAQRALREAK
jgi:hypothetical protein